MNRAIATRAALIVTPLVAFVLYAALNWYEIEERDVRTGMSEAAQRDPNLAFTRLLARMGARTEVTTAPSRLARPPEGGVLLIGAHRLAYMTPTRVRELDAWVQRGGMLVAQAEPPGIDDPLLERFGVERELPPKTRDRARKSQRPPEALDEEKRKARANYVASVAWPGAEKPLRVLQLGPGLRLTGESEPPGLITATLEDRLMIAAFPMDRGRVAFVSDFNFLNNNSIALNDHAEFAWRLATGAPEQRPGVVFLRIESPSLWEWLTENAWPVLIAAAVLLLVWLARIVPRFGPLEPEPAPVRRSLREHLGAAGRFIWSRGEATHLIDAVRERVWRSALRRRGGLKGLAHSKAQETLAEIAERPLATVHRAMHGNDTRPAAFVATASALQEIEAGLAHRSRTTHRTKKGNPK